MHGTIYTSTKYDNVRTVEDREDYEKKGIETNVITSTQQQQQQQQQQQGNENGI